MVNNTKTHNPHSVRTRTPTRIHTETWETCLQGLNKGKASPACADKRSFKPGQTLSLQVPIGRSGAVVHLNMKLLMVGCMFVGYRSQRAAPRKMRVALVHVQSEQSEWNNKVVMTDLARFPTDSDCYGACQEGTVWPRGVTYKAWAKDATVSADGAIITPSRAKYSSLVARALVHTHTHTHTQSHTRGAHTNTRTHTHTRACPLTLRAY